MSAAGIYGNSEDRRCEGRSIATCLESAIYLDLGDQSAKAPWGAQASPQTNGSAADDTFRRLGEVPAHRLRRTRLVPRLNRGKDVPMRLKRARRPARQGERDL